jgi:type IV pilus assembly protein PilM
MFKSKTVRTPVIGIDIGTSQIKMAQFKEDKDKIKLINFGFLPTPAGCLKNGKIIKEDELADAISTLVAFHGFQGKRVAASVSGQQVTVKQIVIEEVPKQDLGDLIKWELDKYISYPVDQAIFDYQILSIDEDEAGKKKYTCLVAVAPTEIVVPLLSTLKKAKLEPFYFEADSFSELRLADFLTAKEEELKNSILVFCNIGTTNTLVEVTENSNIDLTRIIPMGLNFIKEGIFSNMEATPEEAENALLSLVDLNENAEFADEISKKATEFIIPKLEELALEIKRSLNFFNTRFGEENEKPIYLIFSGGGANIKGIVPYMSENIGIKCFINKYIVQLCEYDKTQFSATYLETMAPIFSIAAGLSLIDLEEKYMKRTIKARSTTSKEKKIEKIEKAQENEIVD